MDVRGGKKQSLTLASGVWEQWLLPTETAHEPLLLPGEETSQTLPALRELGWPRAEVCSDLLPQWQRLEPSDLQAGRALSLLSAVQEL